ncbi:rho guanine nucleotide exchange factor 5-like isoform X2 [Dendronephthya gigantea]|nr:rho guanine nucleotide exchange factor 5-like isoform X2 [Dendronephthya gigantea]XP_028394300.1 rho guanine nucleotide exchange factor 5-like isoform X2 [Dendronephthya gigantea]XP_028394301.1 rho guanine nucleotide exchange factor 5-like isoform X2 [Dendronephthya gigantea]XP_028394302.1 rho guanine nucleotide exchange factor 5-like isoform X2 [Dendronephthya gigantea]
MNMAESRPRPQPKPRPRQILPPEKNRSSTNVSPNLPRSEGKPPPITKPKPAGYKQLDFKNDFLVSITTDIDIGDDSEQNNSVGNGIFEKNNNVPNLKHGNNTVLTRNGLSEKDKDSSSFGEKYRKPLPLLPNESPAIVDDEIISSTVEEELAKPTIDMSKLPKKPPRLHISSSDTQLVSKHNTGDLKGTSSVFFDDLNDSTANTKRVPPLPRKPTCLRKFVEPKEALTSTFYTDAKESEGSSPENQNATPKERSKMHTHSDSQLEQSHKPISYLKPKTKNIAAGCTPPLPRKPVRRQPPVPNQVTDSVKKECLEIAENNRKIVSSNIGGSNSRPPPDRRRISMPPSFEKRTDIKIDDKRRSSEPVQTDSSIQTKSLKEDETENEKTLQTKKSALHRQKLLFNRPPPPLTNQGPTRRPPPSLPKRPSLEGKRRSEPPPLPNAPRPLSIIRGNAMKLKRFSRSQSEGDLFDSAVEEDSIYSEAYEHFQDPVKSVHTENNNSSDEAEYESPDRKVVEEFMQARQPKSEPSPVGKENLKNEGKEKLKLKRLESTTYSSSSDDSEHEYVEPASPLPEKKINNKVSPSPTNTVSSGGSSNYVQAIHVSELSQTDGDAESESTTGKYEFKPFNDMDSEWAQTKVIDWEYEGESTDSEASYVEPDGVDDLDDLDDEDDEAFTEEPLYQVYQAVVFEKERTLSLKRGKKGSSASCISPARGRAFTFGTGTLRGGKMLWSQLPEVRNTGLLDNVTAEQRKQQEAIFEVISSEASYLKSLNLLVDHFLKSPAFSSDSNDPVLSKHEVSELFSNIMEVVNVSERFLDELRSRQRQSVLIESISDIITDHATNNFQAYVTYCSNQYKQDRALTNLRKTNLKFSEAMDKLERDSRVFGLSLQSFLVLPMQRVTRYPLLVDAIVRRCEPGHKEYYKTDGALKAVNQVVHKCNEGARKEERKEEMIQIDKIIAFMKMNPIKLVTDDRWLLRRGPIQLLEVESKSTLSNTLRGRFRKYRVKPIYLFLFSDLLVVTKKKTDFLYSVIDYAKRNMIRIQESTSKATNAFVLVFLENFEKKTKELNVRADNETDLTRWKEAFEPPSTTTDDEKIYETWDCPQVQAVHDYQAQQSDELSLVPGDVVNVLRKLSDGWYEGERIRDGVCGWFPANHTEEIRNEHVRARNLHQRYRLLAASTAFLDTRKR